MPSATGKIRYAVVGGGWISQGAFMPGVGQTGNSEMTALVTGDPIKARDLAAKYGLKSYSYEEFPALLSSGEIDAIYLATPNFRHLEFAVPALDAGIHVLLEKPMAISEEECKAINAAAERSGAKLMIAYRLHCEPGTVEMIERVRKGEIGDPRLFTATFTQPVDTANHRAQSGFWAGPVTDMGPYPLNAVRALFADEPIEVSAVGVQTPGRDVTTWDAVAVTLRFPEERLASFTVSFSGPNTERFQLVGRKGEIEASPCFGFGEGVAIGYRLTVEGETQEHKAPVVDHFGGETAYFSDCILQDRQPEMDGEEGWRDVRVLAAIERALESSQPQRLDPLPKRQGPTREQVRSLPLAQVPEYVNTKAPLES
ncbi:Gfo/Idh/MocA family oxidoreductase [Pseudomonas sp. MS15a(2019)]|uniref:Gfo/Idh/MocA family protein n=1 Tax=Pseudomonas sp. MS15a(2019) TaxID=2579938 RepID=UPI0015668321|nr:Gfo/Idh/MocA family oxidoreductase [Pseudomonas sp. MS15a(2019)]NRH43367.1 Gfo/Idh/MocA family oxidoreductase [Pseudomonas sp. MS15a(2019)]